jgi:uncharacterized membrane protein
MNGRLLELCLVLLVLGLICTIFGTGPLCLVGIALSVIGGIPVLIVLLMPDKKPAGNEAPASEDAEPQLPA